MEYIEKVSYKIDRKNTIIEIFDDWENAASVGNAQNLINPKRVIGNPIFKYIGGDSTKMYYDVIFQKCRLLNKEHKIDYRCDSPTHKRFMQMHILPLNNGQLSIVNYLLNEEAFINAVFIEDVTNTKKSHIMRCSICNKLKLRINSDWIAPGTLAQKEEQNFAVIHTICPSCKKIDWRRIK
jgi:hypothetical protein